MPDAAILKMSPSAMVFDVVRAEWKSKFPEVDASQRPIWVIVPKSPPEAAGNSIAALLDAVPDEEASKAIV